MNKKTIDPRGDGSVEQLEIMEGGQPNIIDYSNQEPLLFGAGENSSHEYPGKIVINNESNYVDREVKHDQTGHGTAATGEESVGHDTTQPGLPTGAPIELSETHINNKHGLNFNSKIVWNEVEEYELEETVSIPASAVDRAIASDCESCQRKSNDEIILENEENMKHPGLSEAFVEGDHPRAAAGSSKGGQFVSKEGGEIGSGLAYKTTIQGKEVAVNLRQKKLWEKHTSEEQRNDPDFSTQYGDELIAKSKEEPTAPEPKAPKEKPEPEPKQEPGKPAEDIDRDIYQNLPEDPEGSAYKGMNKRKALFEKHEEKNGRLYGIRDTIDTQKRQIEHQQDMLAKGGSQHRPDDEAMKKSRQENIDALEKSIAELTPQAEELERELIKAGRLEYEEVGRLLNHRQTYVDDLKRRKEGSKKHFDVSAQIMAYDREIDRFRTGKKPGHFPGKEAEEHKTKLQKAYEDASKAAEQERREKNKAKHAKLQVENDAALDRLAAQGLDINRETGKFNAHPPAEKYELPEKIPNTSSMNDHREYLKNYKQVLQNHVDMRTLRVNMDEIHQGYSSDYERRELKEMQWKNKHFVEDHSMIGVVAYNDGDKANFSEYQKKYHAATNLAKEQIKTVQIHKTGGPRKSGLQSRYVTLGSWDQKGKVSLFFNSKSTRKKMEAMGFSKKDWNLTADHEFAHADWSGIKSKEGAGQQFNNVQAAKQSFISDVNDAYDDPLFKLHSYTDSYRNKRRESDITANEAHSKMREFEIGGTMEKKVQLAKQTLDAATEFGEPTTDLGREQIASARGFLKIYDSYKDLREEMQKL